MCNSDCADSRRKRVSIRRIGRGAMWHLACWSVNLGACRILFWARVVTWELGSVEFFSWVSFCWVVFFFSCGLVCGLVMGELGF